MSQARCGGRQWTGCRGSQTILQPDSRGQARGAATLPAGRSSRYCWLRRWRTGWARAAGGNRQTGPCSAADRNDHSPARSRAAAAAGHDRPAPEVRPASVREVRAVRECRSADRTAPGPRLKRRISRHRCDRQIVADQKAHPPSQSAHRGASRRSPSEAAEAVARASIAGRRDAWSRSAHSASVQQAKLGWRHMVRAYPALVRLPGDGRAATAIRSGRISIDSRSARPRRRSPKCSVSGCRGSISAARSSASRGRPRRRAVTDNRSYDEQLPWLQPVEDEDEPRGISARKMFAALLVVLLAALIVAATFFWLGRRDAVVSGPPELIHAPPARIRSSRPIRAGSTSALRARPRSRRARARTRMPSWTPASFPRASFAKPAKEKPPAACAEPASGAGQAPKPESAATGVAGSVIQLGAFANQAQAERAWTALSARFPASPR